MELKLIRGPRHSADGTAKPLSPMML